MVGTVEGGMAGWKAETVAVLVAMAGGSVAGSLVAAEGNEQLHM